MQSYPTQLGSPDHPEGKIQLLDGSIIDAYPKRVKKTPKPAELLTEESKEKEKPKVRKRWHIQTKRAKIRAHIEAHRIRTKDFYENAFFFLENSERILSDSRMFLAPVPLRSNLAYFGHAPFESPTLGIYIEFWKNSEYAVFNDKDNIQRVVGSMAGSTLSGNNFTVCGDKFGRIKEMHITKFSSTARDFMFINKRYKEVKEKYDAYTLSEVIEIFRAENRIPEVLPQPVIPKMSLGQKIKKFLYFE